MKPADREKILNFNRINISKLRPNTFYLFIMLDGKANIGDLMDCKFKVVFKFLSSNVIKLWSAKIIQFNMHGDILWHMMNLVIIWWYLMIFCDKITFNHDMSWHIMNCQDMSPTNSEGYDVIIIVLPAKAVKLIRKPRSFTQSEYK